MIRQTIHVKVTADDIRDGVRDDAYRCAVALASQRSVPRFESCGKAVLWFTDMRTALLPNAVIDAIEAFDNGEGIEPFEFDIEVPV